MLVFNDSIISKFVTSFNRQTYVNCFYSHIDSKLKESIVEDESDIVIVNICDSYSSRSNIANVLNILSTTNPKLVLVDFSFSNSQTYDSLGTDSLYNAIKTLNDSTKLVVIAESNNGLICQSFFMDSLDVEYGLSDFVSYYDYVPYMYDSIPRITTRAAELLGVDIGGFPYPMAINYSHRIIKNKPIDCDDVAQTQLVPDSITDKVVLFGQMDRGRDLHTVPFPIGGDNNIYGLNLIGLELSTLLTAIDGSKDKVRLPLRYLSFVKNALCYIILVLIYSAFLVVFRSLVNNRFILFFLKPVFLLLFQSFLIFVCFIITEKWNLIPDVGLFVLSLPFVNIFFDSQIKES